MTVVIRVIESRDDYAKWESECDTCHSVTPFESSLSVLTKHIASVASGAAAPEFTCRACYDEKIKKIVLHNLY